MAMKIKAPAVRRSQAVPLGPTMGNRPTARAELNWTDRIEVTASSQGGIRVKG